MEGLKEMQERVEIMNKHWFDCKKVECKICSYYNNALYNFTKCWELLSSNWGLNQMAHDSNNLVYTSRDQKLLHILEDRQINYGLQQQQLNSRLLEVESILAEVVDRLDKIESKLEALMEWLSSAIPLKDVLIATGIVPSGNGVKIICILLWMLKNLIIARII